MTEDVFTIENGAMLRGYPRRAESPAAFKWPNEDVRRVEAELAFHVSGSPLSGANVSTSIDKNGKLVSLLASPFWVLMKEFVDAHKRYLAERERFDAYSLWEVIQRLKGESPR